MRFKEYEQDVLTVSEILTRQSLLGNKVAIIFGDQQLTFSQVNERAKRVGNSLLERGVQKGDVVVTYMHNSLDHVLVWLGCAKIGAIWAPANIALVQFDLEHVLRECNPRAIIFDQELESNYVAVRGALGITDLVEAVCHPSEESQFENLDSFYLGSDAEVDVALHWSDPAAIIFTGGSTGLPKGVLTSNAWFVAGVYRYLEMFQPQLDDVHIGVGQLYHAIGSAVDVLSPLYWGLTTVIMRWFNAADMLKASRDHSATISVLVGPVMLALLAQAKPEDIEGNKLRLIASASGGLPYERLEEFRRRFDVETLEIYGQTETGPLGCVSQRLWDRPHHAQGTGNGWVEIKIGDQYGVALPSGASENTARSWRVRPSRARSITSFKIPTILS